MLMITCQKLAAACLQAVDEFEKSSRSRAECIAIMYEPDPACPTVVVFPLPLADVLARRSEPDIVSILNPAEYADELELSLPKEIDSKLPRGDELQSIVRDVVIQLRRDMPDRLVYMTDPECSELADSVREAPLPPALTWLSSHF